MPSVLNAHAVIDWIVSKPSSYPGIHLEPQPRSSGSLRPVEPTEQMRLIWKGLTEYCRDKLHTCKSVRMNYFGAFSFDIHTTTKVPHFPSLNGSPQRPSTSSAVVRHQIKPIFVVDDELKRYLVHYPGKQQLATTKYPGSLYQQGFQMIYANPVPVAASCLFHKELVASFFTVFFRAVIDLVRLGHNVELDFGFVKIRMIDANLSAVFHPSFTSFVNTLDFQRNMKKSDGRPLSATWTTRTASSWGTLIPDRPRTAQVQHISEQTRALRMMSMDFTSCTGVRVSRAGKKPEQSKSSDDLSPHIVTHKGV
eukprot:GILI01002639.1.p2 GENE.GILI01002639.1~~GILI01002639.1.p2  ORF type:complete len:309 (-),score=64.10 GILI01002639.1:397-1323(-)